MHALIQVTALHPQTTPLPPLSPMEAPPSIPIDQRTTYSSRLITCTNLGVHGIHALHNVQTVFDTVQESGVILNVPWHLRSVCCADIHTLLADIGMEQESFESAMTDHKRALELLSGILQVLKSGHSLVSCHTTALYNSPVCQPCATALCNSPDG